MKKLLVALCLLPSLAYAQSSPNLIDGQVPTSAQWRSYFSTKQDALGFRPVNKTGDVMLGLLRYSMPVPVLSSCGTNPTARGNNQKGEVTMGSGSPTGCVITFNIANPFSAAPTCIVTWQANLAAMGYTYTQGALTITQTGTSSNKINYDCTGLQ